MKRARTGKMAGDEGPLHESGLFDAWPMRGWFTGVVK